MGQTMFPATREERRDQRCHIAGCRRRAAWMWDMGSWGMNPLCWLHGQPTVSELGLVPESVDMRGGEVG